MAATTDPKDPPNDATLMPPPPSNGFSVATATNPDQQQGLTADEIAQYDRQLRLWGAQAQEKIRAAKILLISLHALGTEIAKNLTLAGINSLTIIDDDPVLEEDLGAQYFLREEDVGKPRAEAAIPRIADLNPRVRVESGGSLQSLLEQPPDVYQPYSCVIACDLDYATLSSVNTAARFVQRPFYAAGIHGFYGFIFADLVHHEYKINREKSNISTQMKPESNTRTVVDVTTKKEANGKMMEVVTKRELYCPLILANSSPLPADITSSRRRLKQVPALLPCLRALFDFQQTFARLPSHTPQDLVTFTTTANTKSRELQLPSETLTSEFLRSFLQSLSAEMVPTAAFVGGRLSEDVINVLGGREQPIQNFALFDGDALEGKIYCLYSAPPDMLISGDLSLSGADGLGMLPTNGLDLNGQIPMSDMSGTNMGAGLAMGPDMGTMLDGSMGMQMPIMSSNMNGMPMGMDLGMIGQQTFPTQMVMPSHAVSGSSNGMPAAGESAASQQQESQADVTSTGDNGATAPDVEM